MNNFRAPSYHAGFTLVEIMVGLAIGMLATLVIMQVISVFETQKRTTTGTADAQTNGSIALYRIGRELQLASFALIPASNSPLECTTLNISGVADTTVPNRLSPVTITDDTSDTITIRYGDSSTGGVPIEILSASGVEITVGDNFSCQSGDTAISVSSDGLTCDMIKVITASSVTPTTITLAQTAGGPELACLGQNWNEITYAVNNANGKDAHLTRAGIPIIANIVNLQAQYGISEKPSSNKVDQWVDANSTNGWDTPSVTDRNRIKAVRLAIVARNPKMEMSDVSSPCSALDAAAPTGLCAWAGSISSPSPAIDLSADANWKRYRYRVFETIIPLRNVIWSKGTL
ncbi:MAG: PilW family protein [Sideroxydans sp.]|nr:PilW family protein [Sideroxydans sp.]